MTASPLPPSSSSSRRCSRKRSAPAADKDMDLQFSRVCRILTKMAPLPKDPLIAVCDGGGPAAGLGPVADEPGAGAEPVVDLGPVPVVADGSTAAQKPQQLSEKSSATALALPPTPIYRCGQCWPRTRKYKTVCKKH